MTIGHSSWFTQNSQKLGRAFPLPSSYFWSFHDFLSCFREGLNEKKNVFFRALPESPNPPPDPYSGNLVLFFGRQKRRFARMAGIFFDDDNDGFNDNCDVNFGNFDDNSDKND